ncbi:hypothetical protein AC579_4150 [Pseudocercospora musae]|uniref:Uncharacterized protein n=1 Tax=Pseudocercospora musae TaxID=113226 RepID=A0A139IFH2_9PEZI|nr:hypothetical protein AC579_4150 [Pseudocercospora musae]
MLPTIMPRVLDTPITLPQLFSYVAASAPYHDINHATSPFPDLADFLQHELKSALYYGISTFRALKTELEETLIEALQEPGHQDHAETVALLKKIGMGPIADVDPRYYGYVVTKSKYAGDLWYENCILGLATGIKKLKRELKKFQGKRKTSNGGENDDWFVVGNNDGDLEVEKREGREEGEIRVRFERVEDLQLKCFSKPNDRGA